MILDCFSHANPCGLGDNSSWRYVQKERRKKQTQTYLHSHRNIQYFMWVRTRPYVNTNMENTRWKKIEYQIIVTSSFDWQNANTLTHTHRFNRTQQALFFFYLFSNFSFHLLRFDKYVRTVCKCMTRIDTAKPLDRKINTELKKKRNTHKNKVANVKLRIFNRNRLLPIQRW